MAELIVPNGINAVPTTGNYLETSRGIVVVLLSGSFRYDSNFLPTVLLLFSRMSVQL